MYTNPRRLVFKKIRKKVIIIVVGNLSGRGLAQKKKEGSRDDRGYIDEKTGLECFFRWGWRMMDLLVRRRRQRVVTNDWRPLRRHILKNLYIEIK